MKFPLLCLILTSLLRAQELTVPDRPVDHVLDQTGKTTAEERRAAAAVLRPAAEKDNLGVYLVRLNSAAEEPPADVARRLAQNWQGTADRAVVLTAPDMDPPVILEVAGQSLGAVPETEIQAMKTAALAEGAKAAPGLPAMLATAQSVVAQVQNLRRGGPLGHAATVAPAGPAPQSPLPRSFTVGIAGGALVCCLIALFLMRRGRSKVLIFPPTESRHRFSAPHSGGNDAMVHFGKHD